MSQLGPLDVAFFVLAQLSRLYQGLPGFFHFCRTVQLCRFPTVCVRVLLVRARLRAAAVPVHDGVLTPPRHHVLARRAVQLPVPLAGPHPAAVPQQELRTRGGRRAPVPHARSLRGPALAAHPPVAARRRHPAGVPQLRRQLPAAAVGRRSGVPGPGRHNGDGAAARRRRAVGDAVAAVGHRRGAGRVGVAQGAVAGGGGGGSGGGQASAASGCWSPWCSWSWCRPGSQRCRRRCSAGVDGAVAGGLCDSAACLVENLRCG